MIFWDASAAAKLLIDEPGSAQMHAYVSSDPGMHVWWSTRVETLGAIARKARSGEVDEAQLRAALAQHAKLSAEWTEVEPTDRVRDLALRLVRVHPIRAADALQLAGALVAADGRPSAVPFACVDERLSIAARLEGFVVIDDSTPPLAPRRKKKR